MAHDGGGTPHDLAVQTWTMYAIGALLFLIRLFVRIRRNGAHWQLWQAEDYLMMLAMCWYTAFNVTNIILANGGGGTLYLPGQFETFTKADIRARIEFSKIEFASEQCMLNTIYFLKACMLFMYYRITSVSRQQLLVKLCAGYTFCGFVATELTLFFNCHPFSGYWTLPPPQENCATYFRYEVVQAVFNISSDLIILSIIVPLLWGLRMSKQDKLPLIFIFSLGFFLVICAIVSKTFTFIDIYDTSYQFWYLREASIGIYISNLPYIWGFMRQVIPALKVASSGRGRSTNGQRPAGNSVLSPNNDFQHITSTSRSDMTYQGESGNESEENIIASSSPGDVNLSELEPGKQNYILRTTEIHVHRDSKSYN